MGGGISYIVVWYSVKCLKYFYNIFIWVSIISEMSLLSC